MLRSRAVAPLAIDSLRHVLRKNRLALRFVMARRNVRIRVVAEHALVSDIAPRCGVRYIEPRTHAPGAALLRVPAQRKLDQPAPLGSMQICACVVAGPKDEIDRQLFDIRLFTVEPDLPPPLVVFALPHEHRIVRVRSLVRVVFDCVFRRGTVKRSSHSSAPVGLVDSCVTAGADFGIHVLTPRKRRHKALAYQEKPPGDSDSNGGEDNPRDSRRRAPHVARMRSAGRTAGSVRRSTGFPRWCW